MALSLTRGKTFTATEDVTADKLHQLVDNATSGANIDQSDMDSSYGVCYKGSTEPGDNDALWNHTDIGQLLWYNSLLGASSGSANVLRLLAYENLAAGDLVWPYNDSGTVKARKVRVGVPATPICDGPKAIGTAMKAATSGNAAYICTGGGPTQFLCDETIAGGAAVRPSTSTAGRVETADQSDPACVGFLLEGGTVGNTAQGLFVPIARVPNIYPVTSRPTIITDDTYASVTWTNVDVTSYVTPNTTPTHAVVFVKDGVTGYTGDFKQVIEFRKDGSSETYSTSAPHFWSQAYTDTTYPVFITDTATIVIELSTSFVFEWQKTITIPSCGDTSYVRGYLLALMHVP